MSKNWRTQRTPEEKQAIADFNRENERNWYGDYALDGYAYAPTVLSKEQKEAMAANRAIDNFERNSSFKLPEEMRPKKWKVHDYDPYLDYQAGGQWRGYQAYRPATLDYRYIEQMANALASKHSVSVKVGDGWSIDLNAKELTYNPMTLMTGSKAQMIASLLHEIGHLRHTTPVEKLKNNQQYGKAGHEILNLYEDFRVDEIMADSYSGAGSVYEANMPMIESIAEGYAEKEKTYRDSLVNYLKDYGSKLDVVRGKQNPWELSYKEQEKVNKEKMALERKNHRMAKAIKATDPATKRTRINAMSMATRHINYIKKDMLRIGQAYDAVYDELMLKGKDRTPAVAKQRVKEAIALAENGETILGYECLTICEAYGVKAKGKISGSMLGRVDLCKPAIQQARETDSTQGVVDILNKGVYPHIKDLLMNFLNGENLSGAIGKKLAEKANEYAKQQAQAGNGGTEARQNQKSRASGTGAEIPDEWMKGNYDPLKASVATAINDLVQRLRYIKASDTSSKYNTNLKRGKLHGKHLYRLAMGDDRLFRKKTEQQDRIGQVGITVIIDKSGSMHGENMVHTVRGAIILAETCDALGIPLEIMTFSGMNHTLKKHDDPYTKEVKSRLAGLVRGCGGSSNMYASLDKTGIKELKKRNKVAVMLSDGGVGRGNYNTGKKYTQYFDEMRKANVIPVGIGLGCGDEITRLVGQGESTDNAYELPAIFDRIMRGCINKTLK